MREGRDSHGDIHHRNCVILEGLSENYLCPQLGNLLIREPFMTELTRCSACAFHAGFWQILSKCASAMLAGFHRLGTKHSAFSQRTGWSGRVASKSCPPWRVM